MNEKTPTIRQLFRFESFSYSVWFEVRLTLLSIPGYIGVGGGPIQKGATELDCDFTATCCWNDDGAPNAEMAYVVARDDTFLRESAFATYFPSSPKPGTRVHFSLLYKLFYNQLFHNLLICRIFI